MNSRIRERLRSLPWERIREATGDAREIPAALLRLAEAVEDVEVRRAYWSLDNHVVVQGSLSEAAYHVVPFLLELLADRSRASSTALYDLLAEIALGYSPPSAPTVTREDGTAADLREACRERIRSGLDIVRADLVAAETEPAVRHCALHVLMAVETDRTRLLDTLSRVPETADDQLGEKVRSAIAGLAAKSG